MTAKPSKNHPRIIDGRFRHGLATLRATTSVPRPAAILAREMLVTVATRCAKHTGDDDARLAAMICLVMTAHASGLSLAETIDWLRSNADSFDTHADAIKTLEPAHTRLDHHHERKERC